MCLPAVESDGEVDWRTLGNILTGEILGQVCLYAMGDRVRCMTYYTLWVASMIHDKKPCDMNCKSPSPFPPLPPSTKHLYQIYSTNS